MLKILSHNLKLYGLEVHAYVLMGNHFHLLLQTPEGNLKRFMQRLNTSYTVYYNRRHRRNGHLYQGRYKATLIQKDAYLLGLSRYVHLNPVRIKKYSQGQVARKRRMIRPYPWSSYGGYIHLPKRQPFVNYLEVLEMVGGGDSRQGRRRYEEFVMGGISRDMRRTFWSGLRGQVVLGEEDFVDWVYTHFLSRKKLDEREIVG